MDASPRRGIAISRLKCCYQNKREESSKWSGRAADPYRHSTFHAHLSSSLVSHRVCQYRSTIVDVTRNNEQAGVFLSPNATPDPIPYRCKVIHLKKIYMMKTLNPRVRVVTPIPSNPIYYIDRSDYFFLEASPALDFAVPRTLVLSARCTNDVNWCTRSVDGNAPSWIGSSSPS